MGLTRRQREIYDFVAEFIEEHGYSPSLHEIAARFGLSSVATVHKHVSNLVRRGLLRKAPNRNRSLDVVPLESQARVVEVPLAGIVAAGVPIEAVEDVEQVPVPESFVGRRQTFALRVRGDSMIEEQIRDGDLVIVEEREEASNGEVVVALVDGEQVTLKKFYRERGRVRLQPANPAHEPILVDERAVAVRGVVIGLIRQY